MKRLLLILVWIFCAACTTLGTPAPTQIISHSAVPTVQSLLLWQPESREVWLRSVDPGNGQDAAGKPPLRLSSSESMPAVSPLSADEKRLAVAYGDSSVCEPYAGGSRCMGEHQGLALVDVPAWLPQEIELPGGGWVSLMAFSPDSSRLALVYHQPEKDLLLLMNASSGALLASRELPFTAEWMAFVLGGSGLAAFGSSPSLLLHHRLRGPQRIRQHGTLHSSPGKTGRRSHGHRPTDRCDNNAIQIGMPVEMVTRKMRNDGDERGLIVYGYKFRPTLNHI